MMSFDSAGISIANSETGHTRFALFYTKCYGRLLRPLLAADQPPAPVPLRQALRTIDRAVDGYSARAHLERAA